MREIRTSGSEGGGDLRGLSLPLSKAMREELGGAPASSRPRSKGDARVGVLRLLRERDLRNRRLQRLRSLLGDPRLADQEDAQRRVSAEVLDRCVADPHGRHEDHRRRTRLARPSESDSQGERVRHSAS